MLKNILNLEGVSVLNKKQQSVINGGQNCRFTLIGPGGTTRHELSGFSEGSSGSAQANATCASVVSGEPDVDRCFYDCSYDGFGQ